ncbi:hypothetical protein A5740_19135 [Mycobacterium sp. GA-1841]|uniref:hypothetical protein n=1 Tax=Mycobacterium sp. GA-1841 TaxID=1834154 RepID=UPI00096C1C58|nr:hypothetical protein [Mycobacterium sp. GA-1841]OMC28954.1 hypothetical protein A5740_19135 [Mycobacterium sp. GA-1841]
MAGSAPPAPGFVAVATEALHWLSLSVPVGIGLSIAVLALPENRGVVAETVRSLVLPAAALVAVGALVQFFFSPPGRGSGLAVQVLPGAQLAGALSAALGLVLMRTTTSRRLAAAVAVVATLTAVLHPIFPCRRRPSTYWPTKC